MNGKAKTASYGQNSSQNSIISDLANQFNADWMSSVTAQANGSVLALTATQPGSGSNYTLSANSATNNPNFSAASFTPSPSGATLTGGNNNGTTNVIVYRMAMGYDPNGSVANSAVVDEKDTYIDSWQYWYDEFNRLQVTNGPQGGYSYSYDRYGNRWHQAVRYGSGFAYDQTFNAANQSGNATYDAAGNVSSLNDPIAGMMYYTYDAENRLLGVSGAATASYAYDALGRRVKHAVGGTTYNDLYDADGHVTTDYNVGTQSVQRFEIFGGGRHIVTYTGTYDNKTYFPHTDWLGSEHARSDQTGVVCLSSTLLPFGDHLSSNGTCDISPNHFTGKERDTESGNDYFEARYYSSSMGRFLSPDWSAKEEPVPYAKLDDPQSLNLYAYVQNNPLIRFDKDGHDFIILNDSKGAEGEGHNASLVGNDKQGWTYFSANGYGKGVSMDNFKTFSDFQKSDQSKRYDNADRITTTTKQDAAMKETGGKEINKPYSISAEKNADGTNKSQNCADLTAAIGKSGGVAIGTPQKTDSVQVTLPVVGTVGPSKTFTSPNQQYSGVVQNNSGTTVKAHCTGNNCSN